MGIHGYSLFGVLVGGLLVITADRLTRSREISEPFLPLKGPAMGVAGMLLFALLWQRYGPTIQLILVTFYGCVLLLVFIIDLEHRLVLNKIILPSILIALLTSPFHQLGVRYALLGGAIGFGLFGLVAAARKGGMGAGDVKLAAFIGLAAGFPQVLVALAIGILAGGFIAALLLLIGVKGLKSHMAYAPFLVMGGLTALLYGEEILEWCHVRGW